MVIIGIAENSPRALKMRIPMMMSIQLFSQIVTFPKIRGLYTCAGGKTACIHQVLRKQPVAVSMTLRLFQFREEKGIIWEPIIPGNLDPSTGVLKLRDFGSAKILAVRKFWSTLK